jgi:folate-binding protein YgfZ
MTPSRATVDLARDVRETGLLARLGAGGSGLADPGAIRVTGPDALSFLHSQVTNDVEGLAPGRGNRSARVTRQGQLVELFSLHRLPDAEDGTPVLLIVLERERVGALLADLDAVLFADRVELRDVSETYRWIAVQGPGAHTLLDAELPAGEGSYAGAPGGAVVGARGEGVPAGTLVVSRSLTGDAGWLVALPAADPASEGCAARLEAAADAAGLARVEEPDLSALLELLRIEAGIVRIGPDTAGRKRILPETGLEQQTVSYTKGCYLGQEVIARVRTYGRLPFALRALVLDHPEHGTEWTGRAALLDTVPPPGADVELADGTRVGQLASRTLSPVADAAVVYAYLDKTHRTPGQRLPLRLGDATVEATVVLLPLYDAPGAEERVAFLYDRSVRAFAEGREEEALRLLEEALRIDPGFSDGYEAIGVMLGRSERFHEAIDIFKRLEEIAPAEPMVNTNLSLYFMKIGDKETAEAESAKAMQKSMAQRSGRAVDGSKLDEVLAEQRRADAVRKKAMFTQVLEIDPDDGIALFGLGNALSVLEEWEAAAAVLARAREAERDNSPVHLAYGRALEHLGRPAEAEHAYREGMEVASRKGDLMPLKEMEHRVLLLSGSADPNPHAPAEDRDGIPRQDA